MKNLACTNLCKLGAIYNSVDKKGVCEAWLSVSDKESESSVLRESSRPPVTMEAVPVSPNNGGLLGGRSGVNAVESLNSFNCNSACMSPVESLKRNGDAAVGGSGVGVAGGNDPLPDPEVELEIPRLCQPLGLSVPESSEETFCCPDTESCVTNKDSLSSSP